MIQKVQHGSPYRPQRKSENPLFGMLSSQMDRSLLIDREGKQRLEEVFTKGASDEKIITANSSLFR